MNKPTDTFPVQAASEINTDPLLTDVAAAAAACRQYRNYLTANHKGTAAAAHTSYLLDRNDLDTLLRHNELDGIRIYIGHEEKDGASLVRLYMVGCRKEGNQYHDVLPEAPSSQMAMEKLALTATTTTLTSGRPCPSECGGKNTLNS